MTFWGSFNFFASDCLKVWFFCTFLLTQAQSTGLSGYQVVFLFFSFFYLIVPGIISYSHFDAPPRSKLLNHEQPNEIWYKCGHYRSEAKQLLKLLMSKILNRSRKTIHELMTSIAIIKTLAQNKTFKILTAFRPLIILLRTSKLPAYVFLCSFFVCFVAFCLKA